MARRSLREPVGPDVDILLGAFTAGIVWGLIGMTLGETVNTYYVFFG